MGGAGEAGGEEFYPMPDARCPMPHARCPMPNAQCPMPHSPFPIPHLSIDKQPRLGDDEN
ncbi:histidine kinase [Tolypothrix sp. VBCCA 56010]|uniref:histidine kinase n=1 Tax=Tolypothrix sp. VBCCA 56010 TaxID=3137731 RepID=UPI003D7DB04D